MKKISHSKRGISYEKRQATKFKARHKGGPNNPDLIRGKIKTEVKNWARPVHSGVVHIAKSKGIKRIISKSGFTQPAIILAKKFRIKLEKGK
jgi:hypothetical protein